MDNVDYLSAFIGVLLQDALQPGFP